MPTFSQLSLDRLSTCHPQLQFLFLEVIKYRDCTVLVGFRNEEDQNRAFEEGKSQKRWPNGEHNKQPSEAIDVSVYPVDWRNAERNYLFAGQVLGISQRMKIPIRLGADWDGDGNPRNQSLHDLVHFELGRAYR